MPQISQQALAHSATMDENRVHEHALLKYYRNFWDTYKGHVRGLLAGIVSGALVGGAIGLAVLALTSGLGVLALASSLGNVGLVAAFAGAGAMLEGTAMGSAGAGSASRASGLAEKHARWIDPANKNDPLTATDDLLMADGRGHHFEYPPSRDKGKFFVWKSGALGMAIGAATGMILAAASSLGVIFPLGLFGLASVTGAPVVALGAVTCGLLGLSFGIERSVFKSLFNQTDANLNGHVNDGHQGPDLGRTQKLATGPVNDPDLLDHRLQRQEDIVYLQKKYNDRIFMGSVSGLFRGMVGGVAAGAATGLGIGALGYGLIIAASVIFPAITVPAFLLVPSIFAGAGALLGMNVFAETGAQAGAESTARAIDDEFERNLALRDHGITPPAPSVDHPRSFSPRIALIMGAVGTVAGIAITPVLAPALGLVAATGGGLTLASWAASAIVGGVTGASFGVSAQAWRKITRLTDHMYDSSYFYTTNEHNIAGKAPEPVAFTPMRKPGGVTAEDMALLNERLDNAANNKSYTQLAQQQLQASPSSLIVGA